MVRLLLIDDNPQDRLLVMRELQRAFPMLQIEQIIKADDFKQALTRGQFDLVISDSQLRWSDGLAILKTIKSHYPECPVVMFTSSGTEEIAVEAMKARLDDYVIKSPKHYARLASVIRLLVDRLEAQQKATELETRLQTLLNQLQVGIYRIAENGAVLETNAAFLHLLGLDPSAESQIRSLEPYVHSEDYAQLLQSAKLDGHQVLELQLQRADGQLLWVQIHQTTNVVNGTTVIDGLVENIRDRKQTEASLQQTNDRLKLLFETANDLLLSESSQDFVDSVLRKLSVHLQLDIYFGYLIDVEQQRLRLNTYGTIPEALTSGLEYLELSAAYSTMQQNPIFAQAVHASPIATLLQTLGITAYACHPLIVGEQLIGTLSFGTRNRSKFAADELDLMQAVSDQVAAVLDRSRLVTELQQRAEALIRANQIKDEFLAVLSHELRTPLNPILGWAKLLRTRQFDEVTLNRALETIERNAKLQTQLIEDLLDVSRILQGKLSLQVNPVNLVSTVESALETVRLAAEVKAIQMQVKLDPTVGVVLGDSNRLQQVIWNLLSNAVKFTPSEGRVEIKLDQVGAYAQIRVSDTGKGIEPEFLFQIFDYFRQADSTTTRQFGGLGLGLAIARHLVELHGGTIHAASPGDGQGATFVVRLPLMPPIAEVNSIVKPPEAALQEAAPKLNGTRILLVDDEADTLTFITFVLERYGAVVTAVASAKEALEVLAYTPMDILLSDIGMPDIDGYMLIRRIRSLTPEQGGQIPAIALTAYAREEDHDQALLSGFQKHLTKPIEPSELAAAIASLAERSRAH